jgi:predicted lipoprotein with Yx(FWY)xxD motif
MNSDIQNRMLNAAYACMLPLARLLLRAGITYRQFDSIAKRAFVREALAESDTRGRSTNTSRVAVKTGLSRKEVKRVRDSIGSAEWTGFGTTTDQSGPPSRVLHAWHVDERFVDEDGCPRILEFQNDTNGFSALVRAVAGDVPPGAVRAELKRSGAIIDREDGSLQAVKRYYVPGNVDEKAITVMSGMVFPMTAGVAHNSDPARASEGFIQRFAFSDSLDPSVVPQFRHWSRAQATRFIEVMDDWLAEHESQVSLGGGEAPTTAGIGVFYYEGPKAEAIIREDSE